MRIVTLAEAGAHGEVLLNATPGAVSVEALGAAGAADFDGTIVLDVANRSRGARPGRRSRSR